MIAEINGKISRTYSNFSERLEDELTGNVFGNLRYLPFSKGLKKILMECVHPQEIAALVNQIEHNYWADNIIFWPYHTEGEIDVKIDFPEMVIGIEVKYLSGLSSDDEIGYHREETSDNFSVAEENVKSRNQLARESRMVSQWGKEKVKLLLFLADQQCCQPVYEDVKGRGIIEKDVAFGYFTWQDVLKALKKIDGLSDFEQVVVDDLIVLLQQKDFEPFESFKSCSVSISLASIWHFSADQGTVGVMPGFEGFGQLELIAPDLMWRFE